MKLGFIGFGEVAQTLSNGLIDHGLKVLTCTDCLLYTSPYAGDSFRAKVGVFLKEISKEHPTIMYSTLRGFDKIKPVLREKFSQKSPMGVCQECNEPAADKICKACSFRLSWNQWDDLFKYYKNRLIISMWLWYDYIVELTFLN